MSDPGKAHILVLEDDEAFRRLTARMLDKAGYTVIQANDFFSAIALIDGPGRIDLLLADIGMPANTPHGLSVGRTSQMRRSGLKVIYMTGGDPREFLMYADGDTVLQKPFATQTLIAAVEAALKS